VPVVGNKPYNFGGSFKGTNTVLDCAARFLDAVDCFGNESALIQLPANNAFSAGSWTSVSMSGFVASEAKSAYVRCYAFGLLVDQLYLSPAPMSY
jgi:hypothetical protein